MIYDNSQVRRRDRVLDESRAFELLRTGEYGFLSMVSAEGGAYGIPVNYVWNGVSSVYIHCAPEGKKLGCIEGNADVSFCVVGDVRLASEKFTTSYESIVMQCHAVACIDPQERMKAIVMLLEKYSPENLETGMRYAEKSFHRTAIIRMDIVSMSGKCKKVL